MAADGRGGSISCAPTESIGSGAGWDASLSPTGRPGRADSRLIGSPTLRSRPPPARRRSSATLCDRACSHVPSTGTPLRARGEHAASMGVNGLTHGNGARGRPRSSYACQLCPESACADATHQKCVYTHLSAPACCKRRSRRVVGRPAQALLRTSLLTGNGRH